MNNVSDDLLILGWREWLGLPALGIDRIKAKVDTGARTSTLHAFAVETFHEDGRAQVRFRIHPRQKNTEKIIVCTADVVDQRMVSDSGGHREKRWVISTPIEIGDRVWPAEVTLTSRDNMLFRMLLGRTAIASRGIVNPELSFAQGRRLSKNRG